MSSSTCWWPFWWRAFRLRYGRHAVTYHFPCKAATIFSPESSREPSQRCSRSRSGFLTTQTLRPQHDLRRGASLFFQRGHTLGVTSHTGGSSPCTPCSRLQQGLRSNQPFHLPDSLLFVPPAAGPHSRSQSPQQSPLFLSLPICQCSNVMKDIISKVCNYVQPPTSPTNTVSTLSRLDDIFPFSFFLFLAPLVSPTLGTTLANPKKKLCVFRQHCFWYLGRERREMQHRKRVKEAD